MFSVNGNEIWFDNTPFQFKGVSVKDIGTESDLLGKIKMIADMGANSVRLPVYTDISPDAKDNSQNPWKPGGEYIQNILKPAVDYAIQLGLKAVIDLHIIGDIDERRLLLAKTFWDSVNNEFSNYQEVAYEVYNEPINANCPLIIDASFIKSWNNYFPFMNELVSSIRKNSEKLLLVGTPLMCQVLSPTVMRPVQGTNIAYTAHLYPPEFNEEFGKSIPSLQKRLELTYKVFKEIEACNLEFPVVITETGWFTNSRKEHPKYHGSLDTIMKRLGWFAWVFDHEWKPPMLDGMQLTSFGRDIENLLVKV